MTSQSADSVLLFSPPIRCVQEKHRVWTPLRKMFFYGLYAIIFREFQSRHQRKPKIQPRHQIVHFFCLHVNCMLLSKSCLYLSPSKTMLLCLGINERYMEMLEISSTNIERNFIAFKTSTVYFFTPQMRGCAYHH